MFRHNKCGPVLATSDIRSKKSVYNDAIRSFTSPFMHQTDGDQMLVIVERKIRSQVAYRIHRALILLDVVG